MVFQSYALYPHMTVYENMASGLRVQKLPRREIDARVHAAADILNMRALLGRKPHQLSGGQAQRVAIGRAIVKQPRVFLFDEPLSNLDAELRVKMRVEISRLHKQLACTMIYVTHDQVEAMTMADKIVVMREGRIEQVGSPSELYTRPESQFVAGFIGSPSMNFLKGRIEASDASGVEVRLPDGSLVNAAVRGKPGAEVTVGIRPEHLEPAASGIGVKVETVELLGVESLVHSHLETGEPLVISMRGIHEGLEGRQVTVGPTSGQIHVFGADGVSLPRLERIDGRKVAHRA
jgi:ABC-type sugar transport system ATPase subunit